MFAIVIAASVSPHVFPHPNIDQGVYTYIGREILSGGIPYRDLWDHKGPIIYYVYALGLALNDPYGIWILGLGSLVLSVFLSVRLLLKLFGPFEAFLGTLAWLFELQFILDGGNTIEHFNLPLLFWGLYCVHQWQTTRSRSSGFWIGAAGGFSFFFRPNEIGVLISALVLCLIQACRSRSERRFWISSLATILIGFGSIAILAFLFLLSQGTLADYMDSAFRFNYLYTLTQSGKLEALLIGIYLLAPLFILSLTFWLICLLGKSPHLERNHRGFVQFLMIAFPIQIWVTTLSNRLYPHYYISWLPLMSIMTLFGVGFFTKASNKGDWLYKSVFPIAIVGMLLYTFLVQRQPVFSLTTAVMGSGSFPVVNPKNGPEHIYIDYVTGSTDPSDTVWFWGNQVVINVQANRKVPSRFLYPYPFGIPGYPSPQTVHQTINELEHSRPALIIDTHMETFPSLDSALWQENRVVRPLIDFIHRNYGITDHIGPHRWTVWTPR